MCPSPLHGELAGEGGVCVVSFSGGMDSRDHVLARDAVLRTAVTCPTAVVVDLTAFAALPPTAAAAALAVRAQVADWPGTPILLAGAEDAHRWGPCWARGCPYVVVKPQPGREWSRARRKHVRRRPPPAGTPAPPGSGGASRSVR
ncbi:hypothetical protein SUDANB95_03453 [Actinosynnema sp. ALI-1.44]